MLELQHVTIKFGGLTAVNDLSTKIDKGTIFGLIGPNGAGKTTVFNIVSGIFAPTSGKVIFNGEEIQGLSPDKINYKGIARTYQNINVFKKMTVLENVMVGCHSQMTAGLLKNILRTKDMKAQEKESFERSMALLEYVGLGQKANYLASGLAYGEQRSLEIARALASKPELLLLDEPAAGMNLTEKEQLAQLIKKINSDGITILLVEHNMRLVMEICEKICVLSFGKKIAEGDPAYVQNHDEVIASYLGGKHA